jgi:hypothetical protein
VDRRSETSGQEQESLIRSRAFKAVLESGHGIVLRDKSYAQSIIHNEPYDNLIRTLGGHDKSLRLDLPAWQVVLHEV